MKTIVVVGTAWGDEGKGKITDFLGQKADIIARFQGGNNAGHNVIIGNKKHYFQMVPSGILNNNATNLLTQGMVINPKELCEELENLGDLSFNLIISDKAHIIMPYHLIIEEEQETLKSDNDKIQTTKKGIGPCYTDKVNRTGIRMSTFISDNFEEVLTKIVEQKNEERKLMGKSPFNLGLIYSEYKTYADILKPYVADTSQILYEARKAKKNILFEGAQGFMLCIENGTYPYVTSSSPTAAALPLAAGIAPNDIDLVIGVVKSYVSREGAGIMPTEITNDEIKNHFHRKGSEYEQRTQKYRRVGWFDAVIIKNAIRYNGINYIALTLLDALSGLDKIKIAFSYNLDGKKIDYIPSNIKDYERVIPNFIEMEGWEEDLKNIKNYRDLPKNAKLFIKELEKILGVKVAIISYGKDRSQTITRKKLF